MEVENLVTYGAFGVILGGRVGYVIFYKKSVEYLNLVSTYREPYRIKSITSNLSNLLVYSNNYS